MSKNTQPERNNHFSDAELACEYLLQENVVAGELERCYPYYDEQAYFWPSYLAAKERLEQIEKFVFLDHI